MYHIFNNERILNGSITKVGSFDLVERTYHKSIKSIIDYYQSRVYTVASNHLLSRILTTFSIPLSYSEDRFVDVAFARSPYVAKYFNITSDISYGKLTKGVFYNDCDEILLYHDEYFDYDETINDWKNIQSVKVLEHPVSNIGLLLPDGKKNNTETGLVTIVINVPLLLTQYRGFLFDQMLQDDESKLDIPHFIHMYVLPNMLYSHLEIVILNRLMNLHYGAPMGAQLRKHPFPLINYDSKLDKVLEVINKKLEDINSTYPIMLSNIPSVFNTNMVKSLIMPDITPTRQVWWALLISRLRVMKFLIDVSNDKAKGNNLKDINILKFDIKRLGRENIINTLLDKDVSYDINEMFESILAIN